MLLARNAGLDARHDEPSQADSSNRFIHLFLGLVRRQVWVILTCLVLALAVGILYSLLSPPILPAFSTLLLDPRKGGVQKHSVLGNAPDDAGWIESQIGILMLQRLTI